MPGTLAPLRPDLDFLPSPDSNHPGLLVRDPCGYSDRILVVPPPLVSCLAFFDGGHDELDLAAAIARATDEPRVGELLRSLVSALSEAGFLRDAVFASMRDEAHCAFARKSVREAAHAGNAYPDDPVELRRTLDDWLASVPDPPDRSAVAGLVAPHVSPAGGWRSYAAAYRRLGVSDASRTVVILGTSHNGPPNTFGLTAKPFRTPLGTTRTDPVAVDLLAREGGASLEDFCHAAEHSVEFQVVFLQHVLGPTVRIVPVLCGPLLPAEGQLPDTESGVGRFLTALRALAESREGLLFVLGVDLAHVGRRYSQQADARAGEGALVDVGVRDRERLAAVCAGDAGAFWHLTGSPLRDELNWCGTAPIYAFLRSAGPVKGKTLDYEQWNIDPWSVVTFAGMAFTKGDP